MSLTKENIRFIDIYLKNTDIQFIDVRIELLDHIATAVENDMLKNNRSFYDAFKHYMVFHKKQLEKDYENLRKDLQAKSFGILGRKMITYPFVILFITLYTILFFWNQVLSTNFPYVFVVWGCFIVTALIYFLGTFPKRNYRFSSLEMLAWPVFLSGNALNLFYNFSYSETVFIERWPLLIMLITCLFLCSNAAFLTLFFSKRKEIKKIFA